jgi:hypothetical protein
MWNDFIFWNRLFKVSCDSESSFEETECVYDFDGVSTVGIPSDIFPKILSKAEKHGWTKKEYDSKANFSTILSIII